MTTRAVGICLFSVIAVIGGTSLYLIYKGEKVVEPIIPAKKTRGRKRKTVESRFQQINK